MYTRQTTLGELFEIESVKQFLEQAAPQMVSGPAKDYMTPLTLDQLLIMQADAEPLVQAILDVANGKGTDFVPVDPKTQKPKLKKGPFQVYAVDEVDGKMYMINRNFGGCIALQFSKTMNEEIAGVITYQGKQCHYSFTTMELMENLQFLGVFVRDIATEYEKEYTLHFEGFTDTDGNVMDPEDFTFRTAPKGQPDPAYAAHDAVALRAAEEGMVLLKNEEELLPLAEDAHIALFGAQDFRIEAVGAGKINPRYVVRLGQAVDESSFVVDEKADTAILVISRASGENYDNGAFRGEYYLTEEEEQQIASLKEKYKNIIAIINSGYPMDIRWTKDPQVKAVIWTGFSGMLGGRALVNILNGTVNPSGHLTDTWANDYYDIPSSKNFFMPNSPEGALDADHNVWVNTVYEEDIYVGYRYFETFGKEVACPFGWGLSYTTFEVEGKMTDDHTVKATVINTGDRAGREVVQVYAKVPDGKLEQPERRLVAFAKTKELAPGESIALELEIPEKNLVSFDEETSSYIMEAGEYYFYIGTNLKEVKEAGKRTVAKQLVYRVSKDYMKPPVAFTRLSKKDPSTYPQGSLSGIVEGAHGLTYKGERMSIPDREELDDPEVDSWTVEELARFSVCASSGWGMQDVGVAGRVYRLEGRDIPYYAVADGNNGVNINKPNIGMPTSSLVCSTWDPEVAYEVGRVIAEEAKENNVQMILAPAMNIHRNPLCGRQPEYFSEDPLLAGIMAGNQSKGLEDQGVACSVKHVCCNGSEATRKRNHSIVSQRALREIYLRAFEEAFEVQKPLSIMTAYNACNGVFTSADEEMIQGIFRREFGFEGFVMTDWGSYDSADIAAEVQAGNCWLTPGSTDMTYVQPILDGVKNGTVQESRLRQNVKYMYRVVKMA